MPVTEMFGSINIYTLKKKKKKIQSQINNYTELQLESVFVD